MKVGNIPSTETAVIELRYFCELQAQDVTDDSASESQRQFGPPSGIPFCKVNVPYTFSFSASLTSQCSIMRVTSAKDAFELKYQGEDKKAAKMTLQSEFKFDHDLEMEIMFADPTKLMVTYEEGDSKAGSGILTLDSLTVNFLPTFKKGTEARNEIIFLIDRSGSMDGNKILQAKESLLLFLKSLPTDCHFQIVGFGSTFSALFDE
ncbi:unnamed protein product [Dibothriocephalus latus]|uniref:VWFA domain-containing protein n=1 Tax=Dibothriocephalus latus TaxID=60516 RepID=A0A3P6PIE2_DIBLA|nr:unnamed protein product [Dibothriocephalus latus]